MEIWGQLQAQMPCAPSFLSSGLDIFWNTTEHLKSGTAFPGCQKAQSDYNAKDIHP